MTCDMTIRSMTQGRIGKPGSPWRWVPQAAIVAALVGCATPETGPNAPTPRADFIEYRQIVVQSMALMDATLRSLDEISVQANRDPRPAYDAFAKAVHRLEVDSITVRSRTQAMRARGDAYFEHWREYLATVKNQQVRNLAEEHQPELKQSFEQLHLAAKDKGRQVQQGLDRILAEMNSMTASLRPPGAAAKH